MKIKLFFPKVYLLTIGSRQMSTVHKNALSFQTFKSNDSIGPWLLKTKITRQFSYLFNNQFKIKKTDVIGLNLPRDGTWLAYPYTISPMVQLSESCAVYRERSGYFKPFRAIRIYSSEQEAEADNLIIEKALADFITAA